jgi:nitrate reductase gamma subunit
VNIFTSDLYNFLRGPVLVFSLFVFVAGFVYRLTQFARLTHKISDGYSMPANPAIDNKSILFRGKSGFRRMLTWIKLKLQRTIFGSNPVMSVVTVVFHTLLFVTPVFLNAHNIIADQYIRISLFTLPDALMDKFTLLLIAICVFFFIRRLFIPRVRILTTPGDYFVLLLVIAPFITAFIAYHQFFNYKTLLLIHIITGEIAIMAVPFTRLGHMPFFLFTRFFIGGEYNRKRGNRAW